MNSRNNTSTAFLFSVLFVLSGTFNVKLPVAVAELGY
jgi:hypothetical protein